MLREYILNENLISRYIYLRLPTLPSLRFLEFWSSDVWHRHINQVYFYTDSVLAKWASSIYDHTPQRVLQINVAEFAIGRPTSANIGSQRQEVWLPHDVMASSQFPKIPRSKMALHVLPLSQILTFLLCLSKLASPTSLTITAIQVYNSGMAS